MRTLASLVLLALPLAAQPMFECQTPIPFQLSATADCELTTSTVNGSPNGDAYVDSPPSCGFPTEGNQYLIIPGNNPSLLGAPPPGGPMPRPLPTGYSEVQIVIPPGAFDVTVTYNFFNEEFGPQVTFNDGVSIDVVDPATGLSLLNLAYADTNTPAAPGNCTTSWNPPNGGANLLPGVDLGADGPETVCMMLPALMPAGAFLSIAVFSGGDDLYSSVCYVDNILWNTGCPAEWQVNSTQASLDVNGLVLPNPLSVNPAITTGIVGTAVNVNVGSTLVGNVHDLAVMFNPLIGASAGGVTTVGGQVLNLNLADPSLYYLYGPSGPFTGSNFFTGNYAINFTPMVVLTASAQMGIADPGSADGFVLSQGSELQVFGCNAQENFDSVSLGVGQAPIGWTNPSSGSAWTVATGGTPSVGTGPTSASSLPNYMHCETSVIGGTMFVMDSCTVDFTTLSNFNLDFDLSRIGATVGTLDIFLDDGTGTFASMIGSYTGPDPSQIQGGTEWSNESISLLPYLPPTNFGAVRFQYTSGTSFTGDVAIDNVSFN